MEATGWQELHLGLVPRPTFSVARGLTVSVDGHNFEDADADPRVASSEQIQRMNTVTKTINKRCQKSSADKAFECLNDSKPCGRLIASHPLSSAAAKSCASRGGQSPPY